MTIQAATLSAQGTTTRLDSLQVMRGIAALLVVFFHIEANFEGSLWQEIYATFFSRGHIGVDLFFVLSGFLIVYTRPKNHGVKTASKFFLRRILRIWPAYFVITLIYGLTLTDSSSSQILKSVLFLPQTTDPSLVLGFPTLFVGWTLNYEAYFYLMCAVILIFASNNRFLLVMLAWAILTLLLIPMIFGVSPFTPPLGTPAKQFPALYLALISNPIIWEFMLGAFCAWLIKNSGSTTAILGRNSRTFAYASIALFTALYLLLDNKMEPIACGIPSAIMLFSLVNADIQKAWKVPSLLKYLGDISYGIYLCHPIWIKTFSSLAERSVYHEGLAVILIVLATVINAAVLHKLLEKPIQNFAKRRLH